MRLTLDIGKKYPEITGPLSDSFTEDLQRTLASADFSELVLDFKGTRIISSAALGVLFNTHHALKEQGRSMQIVNASDKVTHVLRMMNMSEIFSG